MLPGTVVRGDAAPGDLARGDHGTHGVHVDTQLGRLPVAAWHGHNGPCRVLLRPEQLTVAPSAGTPAAR